MAYEKQNFKNGQVLNAKHLNHMEDGIAAVPSWNQNDPTALDYIEGRTHWVDDPVETVLFEQDVVFTSQGSISGAQVTSDKSLLFENGHSYTVAFNGTEYECIAFQIEEGTLEGVILIGNASLFSSLVGTEYQDSGEPFAVLGGDTGALMVATESGTFGVSIKTVLTQVHALEEKFIPIIPRSKIDGEFGEIKVWVDNDGDPNTHSWTSKIVTPLYVQDSFATQQSTVQDGIVYRDDNGRLRVKGSWDAYVAYKQGFVPIYDGLSLPTSVGDTTEVATKLGTGYNPKSLYQRITFHFSVGTYEAFLVRRSNSNGYYLNGTFASYEGQLFYVVSSYITEDSTEATFTVKRIL